MLDFPPPRLKAYSREAVIAEKLEAMVSLGEANSRMKDFADLWFLARHHDFDGEVLAEAISRTFGHRRTPIPEHPVALTPAFAQLEAKQIQWTAFARRGCSGGVALQLAQLIDGIAAFIQPILSHLVAGKALPRKWQAPGPWRL